MKNNLTAHVMVKNEENFIWFTLKSIIDFVEKILIYDTGSTDNTFKIIKSIKSSKIFFKEYGSQNSKELVALRNDQIKKTETQWFLLLDGDEVWPKKSIAALTKKIKEIDNQKVGIVVKTINSVGDIYHQLPQEKGEYRLLGRKGHLNIRAYKKSPDYFWTGTYPLEGYFDKKNQVFLNDQDDRLDFLDVSYWHLTHLRRSSKNFPRRIKYDFGVKIKPQLLPEVFFKKIPPLVNNPLKKASLIHLLISFLLSIPRKFKNFLK
jgi:glycosyltransferase involved in cell wall biosynthesis